MLRRLFYFHLERPSLPAFTKVLCIGLYYVRIIFKDPLTLAIFLRRFSPFDTCERVDSCEYCDFECPYLTSLTYPLVHISQREKNASVKGPKFASHRSVKLKIGGLVTFFVSPKACLTDVEFTAKNMRYKTTATRMAITTNQRKIFTLFSLSRERCTVMK